MISYIYDIMIYMWHYRYTWHYNKCNNTNFIILGIAGVHIQTMNDFEDHPRDY